MISTVACDPENLGVITDYEVVSHLAHLTHKVTTSAASLTLYRSNSMSVRRLSIRPTGDINRNCYIAGVFPATARPFIG